MTHFVVKGQNVEWNRTRKYYLKEDSSPGQLESKLDTWQFDGSNKVFGKSVEGIVSSTSHNHRKNVIRVQSSMHTDF